ncbi:MAG: hypothetical protein ACRCSF_05725 [Mycobacteriaceae bacterium]
MSFEHGAKTAGVAVAAGVSAVVSSVLGTIGMVGMLLINDSGSGSMVPQPAVVALPSGWSAAPASALPTAPATSNDKTSVGTSASAQPTSPAVVVTKDPGLPVVVPAPTISAETKALPTQLSEAQLTDKMTTLLFGASDARAAELEAGPAALPTVDAVSNALKIAGPLLKWRIVGPVAINGTTLSANLETSFPGASPWLIPMSWIWVNGSWKLTNGSVCGLASAAALSCSV